MIRRIHDIDRDAEVLLAVSEAFAREAGIKVKPEHIVNQARALMTSGIGTFWVYERDGVPYGMVGAILHPSLYDAAVEVTELFWYVYPEHRGGSAAIKLLSTVEDWARQVGAVRLRFAHLHDVSFPTSLYDKLGMKPVETYYSKEL